MRKFILLLTSLSLCFATAAIGSYFTFPAISSWYVTLVKPFFTPPNWLFGPVWSLLYLLMGISQYLIWAEKKSRAHPLGRKYFYLQLEFNAAWSILFFGLRSPGFALTVIIVLWVLIFLTIREFHKQNHTAAYLLYPYLAWVSFATLLNFSLLILN